MSTAQRALPATHGSRTQTITPTPALEAGTEAGPSRPSAVVPPTGVLKLRGGTGRKAKVVWSEEVVDNEGMGRKKSKICCIYNKPRAFDESSSESGSDSEHDHDHGHDHAGPASGKAKGKGRAVMRRPDATGAGEEEMSEPSSESDGGGGDGRARPARKAPRRKHRHHHGHDHDHGADGHECAGLAAKANKYDVQPRASGKAPPAT
ncbi:phosphatase inhibitor-domain-containing protein [Dioszegia hungarica]|uniref:Type 1 phosphatases regulator n=1 Tax=Dioszegia hungarica TaxID=4972 RepID=A0AA38HFT4_9TREE|nr:phosphatase inhibitor-domain-containing protein [Dioszegia hungarica]KAI9639427.1 phosphatase inhibitor-domain-containing protein [Dioszegia hungarica]